MRTRLAVGPLAAAFLLSVSAVAYAQAQPPTYLFGTEVVALPAPEGYEKIARGDWKLGDLGAAVGSAELLAMYGVLSSAAAQTGRLNQYASLATPGDLRDVEVGPGDFDALATRVRTGLDSFLQRLEPDLATLAARLEESFQASVEMKQPSVIGVFDDGLDRIGVLMTMPFTVNGTTMPILSANTIIRVRSRIVFAYVYASNVQPESTKAIAMVARTWTDAIMAANAKPRAPNPKPRD